MDDEGEGDDGIGGDDIVKGGQLGGWHLPSILHYQP